MRETLQSLNNGQHGPAQSHPVPHFTSSPTTSLQPHWLPQICQVAVDTIGHGPCYIFHTFLLDTYLGIEWVIWYVYAQLHRQCQMVFQCGFTNLRFHPWCRRIALTPHICQKFQLPVFLFLATWWLCSKPICRLTPISPITSEVGHCSDLSVLNLASLPRCSLCYRGEARDCISKNFLSDSGLKSDVERILRREGKVIFPREGCSQTDRQIWDLSSFWWALEHSSHYWCWGREMGASLSFTPQTL